MVSDEIRDQSISGAPKQEAEAHGYEAFRKSLRERAIEQKAAREEARNYWRHPKSKIDSWGLFWLAVYTIITGLMAVFSLKQLGCLNTQLGLMKSGQRPFVAIDGLEIRPRREKDNVVSFWDFKPIIVNSGETPDMSAEFFVTQVQFPSEVRDLDFKIPGSLTEPYDPDDMFKRPDAYGPSEYYQKQSGFLSAKQRLPFRGFWINADDINSLVETHPNKPPTPTGARMFIVGTVHYSDQFTKVPQWETKYCFEIGIDWASTNDLQPIYWQCPRWNCADGQCQAEQQGLDPKPHDTRSAP